MQQDPAALNATGFGAEMTASPGPSDIWLDARVAYAGRAAEYVAALGDIEGMSPTDRAKIGAWALSLSGPVLDAGCGPGHWTAHLHDLGVEIAGIDMVTEFVASARARFPGVTFQEGTLGALPYPAGALTGILAWYSLIHAPPEQMPALLAEFARCLTPGGSLLVGFFDGPRIEAFDHAVTTAYFWPPAELCRALDSAGFTVVDVETRTDPGHRPHAAIVATLR
ncbi:MULTISPECIES: class I SAM-dependent methyltransferase [Leucobacter]|uniref:class I SAM-dependent methyltransferase n=1 Tax=Leucobacter TaxID=55968 RepID=UPI0021043503|nr:class I SAM-dependent methyltransferase [Leucobacter aridicollis]